MDLVTATAEDFQALVGESFTLHSEMAGALTLMEVELKPNHAGTDQRTPFALLFKSAGTALLPQSIYQLEHSTTGTLDIFLVPVHQDEEQVLYEAVFN